MGKVPKWQSNGFQSTSLTIGSWHLQFLQKVPNGRLAHGVDFGSVQFEQQIWLPVFSQSVIDLHKPCGRLQRNAQQHVTSVAMRLNAPHRNDHPCAASAVEAAHGLLAAAYGQLQKLPMGSHLCTGSP